MQEIQSIIEHIKSVYGFEITPCSIPRSNFQILKRNFYIFIQRNISDKLFYFIRDKISPIKFLKVRPNGSIFLKKRLYTTLPGDGLQISLCEIEILPVPPETSIHITDYKKIFKPVEGYDNYRVTIYYPNIYTSHNFDIPISSFNGREQIDAYFCDIPEFKKILRDYKLYNILEIKNL